VVAFEVGHPMAHLPIVAGLYAADDAFEAVRGAGGEQRSAERDIAEDGVCLGLAGAVADVETEIGPGPAPCRQDRRLVEQRRAVACGALVIAFPCFARRRLGAELGVS